MHYFYLFFFTLFFSACSEPDYTHPLLQDDTNTSLTDGNIVTIKIGDFSQDLIPKIRLAGIGNTSQNIGNLKSGTYLYSLSYKFSIGVNTLKDAGYMSLINSSDQTVQYMSFPPLTNNFKQMYLKDEDIYKLKSFMVNNSDKWTLLLVHESELSDDLKSQLVPHKSNAFESDNDILFKYQWHLKNTGQSFAIVDAIAGNDINVESVWAGGITGKGVRVAIVDEGVEINHPDLVSNMDINSSWNFNDKSHDPSPLSSSHSHGTAVAGIVGASWKNGIGGRGVAPDSTLISYNMLEAQEITQFPLAFAVLDGKRGDKIDIFNNSWGLVLEGEYAGSSCSDSRVLLNSFVRTADTRGCVDGDNYCAYENQLEYGTKFGREGKGSVYVKSTGNSAGCIQDGVNKLYMNSNWYPDQVERYMLVVGASNADGLRSAYSTPGVNMLVNAPGGASQLSFLQVNELMVITTDLTSTSKGYDNDANNVKLGVYHFDVNGNENYDYSNRMNGTSVAGPVVSGVVALMLEANPNLSSRDIKYILATTTTKNPITLPELNTYSANGFGHTYSKWYGFGRVNAQAAVNEAKDWKVLNKHLDSEDSEVIISPIVSSLNSVATANFNMTKNLKVEYVNIEFGINSFGNEGQSYEITEEDKAIKIKEGTYDVYFEISGVEDNVSSNHKSEEQIVLKLKDRDGVIIDIKTLDLFAGENLIYKKSDEGSSLKLGSFNLASNDYKFYFEHDESINDVSITNRGVFKMFIESGGIQYAYNLKMDLISPSGTVSNIVAAPNFLADENGDNNTTIVKTRMGSNEFLDESSIGNWQFRVSDVNPSGYSTNFKVRYLKLEVYGR